MRIRHSVTRFFGILVIPAIAAAFVGYFGYYTIFGGRGLLALSNCLNDLETIQFRHMDVQKQQVEGARFRLGQRLSPVARQPHTVRLLRQ